MYRVFSSTHRTFRNAMRFHDFLVSDIPAKDFFKDEEECVACRYDFLNLLWQIRRSKVVLKSQIVLEK